MTRRSTTCLTSVATVLALAPALGACSASAGADRASGADKDAAVVAIVPDPTSWTCPSTASLSDDGTGGRLPLGAVAVQACPFPGDLDGALAGPLSTGILTHDVDTLVLLVDDAPPLSATACPADAGLAFSLAFVYADGSVRVAQVQTGGCGTVRVGGTAHAAPGSEPRLGGVVNDAFERLLAAPR